MTSHLFSKQNFNANESDNFQQSNYIHEQLSSNLPPTHGIDSNNGRQTQHSSSQDSTLAMSSTNASTFSNTSSNHKTNFPSNELPLLEFLGQNLEKSQIHRCLLTQSLISQDEPLQLIYHYENLDEAVKSHLPLQGNLLVNFNQSMTREMFASIAKVEVDQIASPWQLKFMGKIVIYFEQPEIALRLHWANTLKPFEIVNTPSLELSITPAFENWQFIERVEVICKDPNVTLTAELEHLSQPWQQGISQSFVALPASLSLVIQQFLHEQQIVKEKWLSMMIEAADLAAQTWIEEQVIAV